MEWIESCGGHRSLTQLYAARVDAKWNTIDVYKRQGDTIATSRAESYQKVIISVLFVYGGTDFEPRYQPIDMVLLVCSCS